MLLLLAPITSTSFILAQNQAYTPLPQDVHPNLIVTRRLAHPSSPSRENTLRLSPAIERETHSSGSKTDPDVDQDDSEEQVNPEDSHDEVRDDQRNYQVPVLYFTFRNLSSLNPTNIETVYKLLTPKNFKSNLERTGVMGGITMGLIEGLQNHPLTDFPSFFVHPCNTAEAMRELLGDQKRDSKEEEREVSPIEYLMTWFGLVGSSVGLHIPRELAFAFAIPKTSESE
ncbi:MAG: hypothetical protein Q9191_006946 [Dirinaria sp. TL-2023a]